MARGRPAQGLLCALEPGEWPGLLLPGNFWTWEGLLVWSSTGSGAAGYLLELVRGHHLCQ